MQSVVDGLPAADAQAEGRGWRLASALVGVALAGLLSGYRATTGCGLGSLPKAGELSRTSVVRLGLFGNDASHDSLQHAAWPQQAMHGRWTFFNPFTLDPHEPLLINVLAIGVGRLANALGRAPIEILNGLSLAAAALLPYLVFRTARRLGCRPHAAFVSAVLVATASGWSALFNVAGASHTRPGIDVSYLDAIFFSTLLCYPLIAVAYLILVLLMLGAAWLDQPRPSSGRLGGLVALAVGNMALGLVHPYEPAILAGSYFLFWVVTVVDPNTRPLEPRRRGTMFGLAAGAVVVTGYYLWLSKQMMWRDTSASAMAVPRLDWVVGYGTLLPLALMGGLVSIRSAVLVPMRWPLVWSGSVLMLLVGLETSQSKLCTGLHLPLCLLAGVGFEQLHRAVDRSKLRRLVGMPAVLLVWGSLVYGNVALLSRMRNEVQVIDSGLLQAAQAMEAEHQMRPPRVLCPTEAGRRLAAVMDLRLYAANAWRTPRYYERRRQLGHAGVELEFADALPLPLAQRVELLESLIQENDVEEVLVEKRAPAREAFQSSDIVRFVGRYGKWLRYQRARP